MTFTRVLQTDEGDDTTTLHMLGADGKRYAMTLTPEAASQVQASLLVAGSLLRQKHPDGQHGVTLDAIGFQAAMTDSGEALVIVLKGGLELVLQATGLRDALLSCIGQLPERGPGGIH